jgi:hypothetical protein
MTAVHTGPAGTAAAPSADELLARVHEIAGTLAPNAPEGEAERRLTERPSRALLQDARRQDRPEIAYARWRKVGSPEDDDDIPADAVVEVFRSESAGSE